MCVYLVGEKDIFWMIKSVQRLVRKVWPTGRFRLLMPALILAIGYAYDRLERGRG